MNNAEFKNLVDNRLVAIQETLAAKGDDYATDTDRLHNFKRAAEILDCTPEDACLGMQAKHIVSVFDMVDQGNDFDKDVDYINEKIGDAINYFILLEALLKERIRNNV